MATIIDKLFQTVNVLKNISENKVLDVKNAVYCFDDFKHKRNSPPENAEWNLLDGNRFKCNDNHIWIKFNVDTPKEIKNPYLFVDMLFKGFDAHKKPQGLVYLNGEITCGLDINHQEIFLEENKHYSVLIYMYLGIWDKSVDFDISLKTVNKKIESLYYDLLTVYEAANCLDDDDENKNKLLYHIQLALDNLDLSDLGSKSFLKSIDRTRDYVYKNILNGKNTLDCTVNLFGHTHIDVAWLWTAEQSEEKAQRSFSTVINLMKMYDEYRFMSSQPQLYQYVKDNSQKLYEKIKEAVKSGRWEAEGAMYLEADCNLTCGESLVRQIMIGKKFFKEEFGKDSKILWLPDVFGYSAALPQILKKCGVEKFVTSKISWNDTNKIGHDTFMWEGIDGTEIFTQFITTQSYEDYKNEKQMTTYNGNTLPTEILGTWKRYSDKLYNDTVFIPFGYGDGGGGPTKRYIEIAKRMTHGICGFPKTVFASLENTLDKIESNFTKNSKLLKSIPRWVGELYLEFHRGTYTSIAKNKKNNRKSEFMLRDAEFLSSICSALNNSEYSLEKFYKMWKKILLNQFHDILPGSSIEQVYKQTDIDYKEIFEEAGGIIKEKTDEICKNIQTDGGYFVYNPNSFVSDDYAVVDGKCLEFKNIPPKGYAVMQPSEFKKITCLPSKLENDLIRVEFDKSGNILSIFDKTENREVIKKGSRANVICAFEDYPKAYDAWEISDYYRQKRTVISDLQYIKPFCEGARGGVEIKRKYLNSSITQKIYIYQNSKRIDFETVIDWKESHILLKAEFPFDIHCSEAYYDIQFGYVKRNTFANTSWDEAKFEVCAHKWADISEYGYGVGILNDCKAEMLLTKDISLTTQFL